MDVSIVIPSYHSTPYIHRCLDSVLSGTSAVKNFEIFVVDSSETPLPEELRRSYKNVTFIHSPKRLFAGAARNLGAKSAQFSWLCFLDSDCLWSPNWFNVAAASVRKFPEALAFNGQIHYENPGKDMAFTLHLMEFHEFLSSAHMHQRFIHSGNLLIKKEFFEKIGGFREDIPMCTDFTFAATINQTLLKRVHFIPDLKITHLAHLTAETEISKKAETMGYWRGFVEKQIPPNLQIAKRYWFKISKKFLGDIFLTAILIRSIRLRSMYLSFSFRHFYSLRKLCNLWAAGFLKGIKS
ncbi:MAG: hypothetical protein JWQ35_2674 [Bacteriovoracaceae bacterium]|nr:hypothetical protein [Bacteriovoracaceae bacterium]